MRQKPTVSWDKVPATGRDLVFHALIATRTVYAYRHDSSSVAIFDAAVKKLKQEVKESP